MGRAPVTLNSGRWERCGVDSSRSSRATSRGAPEKARAAPGMRFVPTSVSRKKRSCRQYCASVRCRASGNASLSVEARRALIKGRAVESLLEW